MVRPRRTAGPIVLLADIWTADRGLTVLLALLIILLFVVTPLTRFTAAGTVLNGLVFTLLAITGTAAIIRQARLVVLVALLGVSRLLFDWFSHGNQPAWLLAGDLMLRACFVLLIAVLVTLQIFRPGRFSHHRVQGAVAIYLLAALAWAYAHEVLYLLDPGALRINLPVGAQPDVSLFRFFSFETLTTLGYGDILPAGSVARALASAEALFGQLFPAVMITRLVSLEFAERGTRPPAI